jgi:rhodanese-related sulfurtransferase
MSQKKQNSTIQMVNLTLIDSPMIHSRNLVLCIILSVCAFGCLQGQNKNSLLPQEFANKLKSSPTAILLDVRTPEEYAAGHLAQAKNIDWNGSNFEKQVASLNKSNPVFVYCLSGGRSASAASKMRSMGFKSVTELDGGMRKWQGAKLPVTRE